ncbi:suppressor APC domain-containing protein 2 [Halichoeres trimaculatus]|uniref:suppressor APC domain-containing protein 2 n=1 Tax=Halichoeres trimaculatus TaxID=147232 RepID=UPI003D9F66E7
MACRCSSSYTVVIIPLRSSLCSLDALHFYLWIKRLKDLEREKDALCSGLEVLEKAHLWYLQQLEKNRSRQDKIKPTSGVGLSKEGSREAQSCFLRSCIQRVNGSLGTVMSEPNVTCSNPSLTDAVAESDLRWHNTVLTKEVSNKNRQIALLELEKDTLLEQLRDLQTH